jgi:hypothetical protein
MPKNAIIFSNGSIAPAAWARHRIDPSEQVAFYDPCLGSAADGGQSKVSWLRTFNDLASITGLGITANKDCKVAS